ncbi:hypothetical protein BDY21DRAFT_292471 [Lineolata rhizophorae]|uniref:Uncharacterized protein n=1 Tax=Lineolata rhizophorae TaxID=578093 RepID=A0A6A6NPM8_9PEZI|nr:hypothetical protein BDY21DRAFT_292471 [Lineolata rhizophorae]
MSVFFKHPFFNSSQQSPAQPRPYIPSNHLPNGGPGVPSGPAPGAVPLLPNQGRIIQQGSVRVLCVADVRGNLRSLNELATKTNANYIIHTGDFGFYDDRSIERIAEKTLKHVAQYSPLLNEQQKRSIAATPPQNPVKDRFIREHLPLSELPLFLNKTYSLNVPVYTVWGACEDVQVLEKLRSGEYKIDNLHIIDEAHSRLLDIGGVRLRMLGLGGAVVMHKLFDNGEGRTTIAGGQGTMWTTLLQMGELIDTANRVYDPTETRVFVTHASPAREGLLNQLSVTLKADFSVSAGLHFRYGSSYNEFSVNPTLDHYRGKLAASKASFYDVWDTVKGEVEPAVADNEAQQRLLRYALDLVDKMPTVANGGNPFGGHVAGTAAGQVDESAFKNMWNFNLADAAFGFLVLEIDNGRIGTEMRAQGFNFSHRGGKGPHGQQNQQGAQSPATSQPPSAPAATGPPQAPATSRTPNAPSPAQPRSQPGPSTATPPASSQMKAPMHPARAGTSPDPKDLAKPATPQPAAPAAAATDKPSEAKPNGTAGGEAKPAESPALKPEQQQQQPTAQQQPKKDPIAALFVGNVKDEAEAKNCLAEDDRAKVQRIERIRNYCVVHFSSSDEVQSVLSHVNSDYRTGKSDRPSVKVYNPPSTYRGGAGTWQASQRGGPQGGGYRSGGASDSETGRGGGRGGFGRGRGRGGERGRGRGRGGGFGGGRQGESAATSPAPAGGE